MLANRHDGVAATVATATLLTLLAPVVWIFRWNFICCWHRKWFRCSMLHARTLSRIRHNKVFPRFRVQPYHLPYRGRVQCCEKLLSHFFFRAGKVIFVGFSGGKWYYLRPQKTKTSIFTALNAGKRRYDEKNPRQKISRFCTMMNNIPNRNSVPCWTNL